MKIKDKDLKNGYLSWLREKQTKAKDCPPIKVLINTFSTKSREILTISSVSTA